MLTEDKSYKTPGVYLEEIFPAPAPELITGVPAFLGLTEVKDANQAKLLKLWPQFEQFFGQPSSGSYLAHAVRGFLKTGVVSVMWFLCKITNKKHLNKD